MVTEDNTELREQIKNFAENSIDFDILTHYADKLAALIKKETDKARPQVEHYFNGGRGIGDSRYYMCACGLKKSSKEIIDGHVTYKLAELASINKENTDE